MNKTFGKKAGVQILFLLLGLAFLVCGVMRGEADTVLTRRSNYVWSVWALDKKKPFSFLLARWRGLVQACAALLTNLHLPNFLKGGLYQGAGKPSACRG